MKIAFIYPAVSESGFNIDNRDIIFNNIHPGLCLLSAVCKEKGFNDISLIDLRALSDWDNFRSKLREIRPDVAGVTTMSPDFKYARRAIEIIKETDPRITTIIGGIHPTIKTEDVINDKNIDYIVKGEGEIVLPRLLKAIEEGRKSERVIKGESPDINELPFIDRELFDCLEMPFDFFLPLPFVTVLAGRGCSYSCKFCSPIGKVMYGSRIRRRTVDHVMDELRYLEDNYGFKSMLFWDDCFTEDKDWVMEFCGKYKKNGFTQPFVCQMRADIICKNPDMMKELKKAGMVMACIGFESGNDRVLKFANKGTTVTENLKATTICKRLGIKIWAFLMFGMPTETNDEACDTLKMIKKIRPYRSSAAFFTPHPGSVFYDYCKKHDLSLIDEYDDFVKVPEMDKAKIKNIDYDCMRKLAVESKKLSLKVKAGIRIERVSAHKRNKRFRISFSRERSKYPALNKMAVLKMAHNEGVI